MRETCNPKRFEALYGKVILRPLPSGTISVDILDVNISCKLYVLPHSQQWWN